MHRQPGDQPPGGLVHEHLAAGPRAGADELAEHRLGVDAGRPLRGALVRGQQRRHVGGVGGAREPGGEARREPVDRHVGVGHADHSPTHSAPRLLCLHEGGHRWAARTARTDSRRRRR